MKELKRSKRIRRPTGRTLSASGLAAKKANAFTDLASNEARELNSHRIRKFKLDEFVDSFVSSCFVHLRKPDADIFRLAIEIAQVPACNILYIENTPMFVQIAEGLGIRSILHTDHQSTCSKLVSFGLESDDGATHEAP